MFFSPLVLPRVLELIGFKGVSVDPPRKAGGVAVGGFHATTMIIGNDQSCFHMTHIRAI